MKPLIIVFALLSSSLLKAAEGWWLEMEMNFHDALIKHFTEGDPASFPAITDRLPALVKEGKIKELEWIDSDSQTGGRNHPLREIEVKYQDGRKRPVKIGSSLHVRENSDTFLFDIKGQGGDFGSKTLLLAHARFTKQWQPLFTIESGGRARVFLGRDLTADRNPTRPMGRLSIRNPFPVATKVTWFLGEGHPLLEAGEASPSAKRSIRFTTTFEETTGLFVGRSKDRLLNFGTTVKCETRPGNEYMIDFTTVLEKKGASNLGEVFQARAPGKASGKSDSMKIPVNSHIERIKDDGEGEYVNERVLGEAEATITIF